MAFINQLKIKIMKSEKNYYVYVQGILNLWALVYTTNCKDDAKEIASEYARAKVLTKKMIG
jgi:hypothetical protein